jgi:hypothetical protein
LVGVAGLVLSALPGAATSKAVIPSDDVLIEAFAAFPLSGALVEVNAHEDSILVASDRFEDFPVAGGDYIIMSTGNAADVLAEWWRASERASTDLGIQGGADGHDLTQLTFDLEPPDGAECFAFDFQFLAEDDPYVTFEPPPGSTVSGPWSWEVVGSSLNDVFTAELNENLFSTENGVVVAPNNLAYDSDGNAVSINTVADLHPIAWSGTRLDWGTYRLTAVAPVEADTDTGRMSLILSVQDVGNSLLDSAVLLDNFRWRYNNSAGRCGSGVYPTLDVDGDGLPDDWEINGIDYDGDGIPELDLPALGADPLHADIFLEIDWMVRPPQCAGQVCWGGSYSFQPRTDAMQDVVDAFADAPYRNPDRMPGINLHIDAGRLSPVQSVPGGPSGTVPSGYGGEVPWRSNVVPLAADGGFDWTEFEAIKVAHFGPADSDARRDAFHYVLYADRYGDPTSSGISRGIPAADFVVTDGPAGALGFTRVQERGTLMHELGHNLGLRHGGPDDETFQGKAIYVSIMNYFYQLDGLPPAEGSDDPRLDYSRGDPFDDWAHVVFRGGSIGDFGDDAPVMVTYDSEELHWDPVDGWGGPGIPGDGNIGFMGPNVFAAGEPDQTFYVRVANASSQESTYQVTATIGGNPQPPVEVVVAGRASEMVAVAFTAVELGVGELSLELALSSDEFGPGVAAASETLLGMDLSAAGERETLVNAIALARANVEPPHDLVLEVLDGMVGHPLDVPGEEPGDDSPDEATQPEEEPQDPDQPDDGPSGDASEPAPSGVPEDGSVAPGEDSEGQSPPQGGTSSGRPTEPDGGPGGPAAPPGATPTGQKSDTRAAAASVGSGGAASARLGGALPATGGTSLAWLGWVTTLMVAVGIGCAARRRRLEHGQHWR